MVTKQTLKVLDYQVWIHLGCTTEELRFTQPVDFTVEIQFQQNLKADQSDRLKDAIDYVTLTEIVKDVAIKKPYHLVEHLGFKTLEKISEFLMTKKIKAHVVVQVKKNRVPVENLKTGVIFICETTL